MKSFNLYKSKIYKFFDYVFRLVLINLLILVPSFLIIYLMSLFFKEQIYTIWGLIALIPALLYLYPAVCAGVDLIRKYEMKECNTVFKEFFKSFKKVYLKALLETLLLILVGLLFGNSIVFFYVNISKGVVYGFGLVLALAFTIMLLTIIVHLPLVMNYMAGCRIIDDIKLASMMAFQDLAITIGIVIVTIAMVSLSMVNITIAVICGFSLPLYLLVKLTFKKYYIVYIRTHKNKE